MCEEFRDKNEHVHWAVEKVSMNKTDFDQASFMRSYRRKFLSSLNTKKDCISIENWSVFNVYRLCESYLSRYFSLGFDCEGRAGSQFSYLFLKSVHHSLMY